MDNQTRLRLIPRSSSSTSSPTPEQTTTKSDSTLVDPGQVIRVEARFPGDPKNVLFSFLPPNSKTVTHDPGCATAHTKISRNGDHYSYFIDTAGMFGGQGWWYFYSEDPYYEKRRAKVGTFIVRDVPRELIDRNPILVLKKQGHAGMDLIGADDTPLPRFVTNLLRRRHK